MDRHHHTQSGGSSSSAIDLTVSPSGIGSSGPSSPNLKASEGRGSFARRRTSWGRTDTVQDPLRFDLDPTGDDPHPSTPRQGRSGWTLSEDPFTSPSDDDLHFNYDTHVRTTQYTSQPGQSSASLIGSMYNNTPDSDSQREDDEAHLTSNMSRMGNSSPWQRDEMDPERTVPSSRSGKAAGRYSTSPSPLKKTGTRFMDISRSLKRASYRVVNLAGNPLENHIRLDDQDEPKPEPNAPPPKAEDENTQPAGGEEPLPDLGTVVGPIRGRTLGFLGPSSSVRLAMYRLLLYQWTEPFILLLIIFNAVVLTIQAARNAALAEDGSESPPQLRGYFHAWEDFALFTLFVLFTLEAFARIAVSGFLLDPEVPVSSLFTSIFSEPDISIPPSASIDPTGTSLARNGSLLRSNSTKQMKMRGSSFMDRFRQFRYNITRPFALRQTSFPMPPRDTSGTASGSRRRSDTVQSRTPMMEKAEHFHSHIRNPSHPAFTKNLLKSDNDDFLSLPFRLSIQRSQTVTERNLPYLRQSWNRIDFIAVLSFWVTFGLSMAGVERGNYHIGIFRALSVLRTARLLAITSGTTTIMQSLKTARPLLASVAYFVLFAMIIFSIIGIQSFKGSFRRTCHLLPILGEDEIPLDDQPCGAYIDSVSLNVTGYVMQDGTNAPPKGFICPLGQICRENDENSNSGLSSFDTIYFAALQVFIVSSANGWTPVMYQMMDSEFYISALFFIVCIIVLNFWLINLFVAVITNTFSAIRKDTQRSAFGAAPLPSIDENENASGWTLVDGRRIAKNNRVKEVYENVRWCWVALALASLVLQATRKVEIGAMHQEILDKGELVLTIVFDVEIFVRVLAHLPDWRSFFYNGQNWLDLVLAIGSTIIQIPVIHTSAAYPWLTIFQLMRFYRVILEIPRMKPLLLAVFGNMYGLANMSLFLILINFLTALVAVQLLRGDVAKGEFIDFGEIFNSFLAIYQVFSSENWTDVLYGAAQPEIPLRQSAIVVLFISGWMFFANFIVLQMFIAVINENFDVAEESKKSRQASHYWASHRPQKARAAWIRRLNPYRWMKAQPKAIAVEQLPSNLVLPMQKSLIQDSELPRRERSRRIGKGGAGHAASKSLNVLQQLFTGEKTTNDVPLATIRNHRAEPFERHDPIDEETERHLEVLAQLSSETAAVEDMNDILNERRAQKADFIREHPTYDKTFWIFSQKNILRRFCQKLVAPANGERIFGSAPDPFAHPIFQLVLLLTVIGGIVTESIATPIYRRNFYLEHGLIRGSWFDIAEGSFAIVLLVEFIIKIIADGLVFTPNAYILSIWNVLDLLILIGIMINVTTGIVFIGGLSRLTRSLKALRALRLITLVEKMRTTFESLIISGASRIMDAALLAILYMIPYAVWGLNIFAGLMNQCNDGDVAGIAECTNEYSKTVVGDSFGFLVPRVWDNPQPSTTFSFDSFRSSLLILFEIVSLEGWIDVMAIAVSITGQDQQPQQNVSQGNAIFFLVYNLLGGVVILTLFISIIIGNFTAKTGSALLTQAQREWIDLQKLIKRQRPSKRPKRRSNLPVRGWCFDRAVRKHGWWYRSMTVIFVLHVIALMTQTFSTDTIYDEIRNDLFLVVTAIYLIDIVVRLYGLGWNSYRANGWNLFDILVAVGSLTTTLMVRAGSSGFAIEQLQKLFITSIAFKLVQRTNSLNKLFKTAVASLPTILSLLGLWIILFLFFGILFLEVFSMTKWNTGENRHQNYTSLSNSLIMLAFMTTGEGWNQYMHDYAIVYPRCTNSLGLFGESDCGSVGWAFTLFIAWNILSMYIFANLFIGVVVESFYYVFQMTGGAKSITREEIRAFKKVWAEFANPKTGYLERTNFVPFFGKLTGIFEVRIYPVEYSTPALLYRAQKQADKQTGRVVDGIDVDAIGNDLKSLNHSVIKKRKELYNRLYHESRISHEPGKGISFTNMLLLLAHHKLIVDREALILKDLVIRTETTKLVTDLVDFDRVQSLLLMILHRRRYVRRKEEMRMAERGIPAIIVDDTPSTPPPIITRDITSPRQDAVSDYDSPSPRRLHSPELSFVGDAQSGAGLHRSRRISDISMLSTDITFKSSFESSRDSGIEDNAENVLSSHEHSIWRDLLDEAAEEEDR